MNGREHFKAVPRLGSVILISAAISAGTLADRIASAEPTTPPLRFSPGDVLPTSIVISTANVSGQTYGVSIIDGRTVLVVDVKTRRVLEVLE